MPDSFVHLHVHTEYSMLDGAAKVAPLFAEAARLEMPAVAMTDHGNMFGSAEFYTKAKDSGIKPIIGIEAYLAPGSRHHKKPVFWGQSHQRNTDERGMGGDLSGNGAYTHMTMLAADATGLRNLFRLSSIASFEGKYRAPRMDRDLLADLHEGIIATTGCPSGEVQIRLRLGQPAEALQAASDYRDIFGPENFYLELMHHGLTIEAVVRDGLLDIGRKLGLPILPTNDSHYVTEDQAEAHKALLCVQSGKMLSDPARFKLDGGGYHLKSAAEMRGYWDAELPGACDNTLMIAERIGSYDEVFAKVDRMPRFPLEAGRTEDDLLRSDVEKYIPTRFPNGLPSGYAERIDFELKTIAVMGFAGYFLVVGDLVRWAKQQGYAVGPGRGSATGSLVVYILHITDLDPIEHSLIFERFLNPQRVSPPDIDLDFDEYGRTAAFEYTVNKWGAENVAQVITFGTIKTKAAIKDAARVQFGQPGFSIADRISKALPPAVEAKDIPIHGIFDPTHPRHVEAAEVRSMVESDPQVAKIMDTARGLEGLIRNAGVHACAVILSSQPLLEVIPLWRRDDGSTITGWDYPSCEDRGLLKIDFLGLRNLTVIGNAINAVKASHGINIDLSTLALDDRPTYEMLSRGDALGVFQLDGGGMRELLKRMQPKKFGDISAAIALYRPGPMAANAHMNFAERSNGRQKITPIHPELWEALDPILGETFHLVVYQEQVMQIARDLAGYTMSGADLLRRAMGKKKKEVLEKEFKTFQTGMSKNGFGVESSQAVWDVLLPFSGYAFNKSHTAGYALVAYWTGYLKANYPGEYMAALLTSVADKKDKAAVYLGECRRMGIKVLPPDVNESMAQFSAVGDNIRFGLGAIRNVGANVVDAIIETRRTKGAYTSFADFLVKAELVCCNKRVVESLIKAGAFDSFSVPRQALLAVHEDAVDAVTGLKRQEALGQFDLFGAEASDTPTEDASPLAHLTFAAEEWPRQTLLSHEREMLGLYVSAHPLDGAEHILRRHAPKPISTLMDEAPKDGEITIAGVIASVERRVNKKGEPWAIVTVEDLDRSVEVLFFAKAYALMHEELVTDSAVAIKGRPSYREAPKPSTADVGGDAEELPDQPQIRDETMSIMADGLITLDVSDAEYNPQSGPLPFVLRADSASLNPDGVNELKSVLNAHRGDTPVHIVLCGSQETWLEVPDYPVRVSGALVGEIKGIRGITVDPMAGVMARATAPSGGRR